MSNIKMAWSKCKIEISPIGNDGLPTSGSWTSIGTIKDKSSSLTSDTGEELEAYATGHLRIGYEQQEGGFTLTTTVIEPTDTLLTALGLGEADSSETGTYLVKGHVPGNYYGVRVTPKNAGARGIEAPYCFISTAPGWAEDTGHELTLTVAILHGEATEYWYKKFTTSQSL